MADGPGAPGLLGDHTKTPKDGRRIPAVETMHQDSETASKPSYFRGHHWGCVSLLVGTAGKFFAAPLWAEIHGNFLEESRSTRIVSMACGITQTMAQQAYLVLDAFFAVGPVFQTAAATCGWVHILTRAKKNIVAYLPAPPPKSRRRGRRRKYGRKLKRMRLFDTWAKKFKRADTDVYGRRETVRYLTVDLLWKPVRGMLRFFLIVSPRGPIILMTSDLTLDALVALELYCRRTTIERMFDAVKNILGGMRYHFWSKYLPPSSRRPTKATAPKPISSQPAKTQNTLAAIEKFLQIQLVVLGVLHLLACRFPRQIILNARCWLRTPCRKIPSEFVTRMALANMVRMNLISFAKGWITIIIRTLTHNARRPRKVA